MKWEMEMSAKQMEKWNATKGINLLTFGRAHNSMTVYTMRYSYTSTLDWTPLLSKKKQQLQFLAFVCEVAFL